MLKLPSFSRSFNSKSLENWKSKLCEVHLSAWETWHIHLRQKEKYSLAPDAIPVGGNVPSEVLEGLEETISNLPAAKKYSKVK